MLRVHPTRAGAEPAERIGAGADCKKPALVQPDGLSRGLEAGVHPGSNRGGTLGRGSGQRGGGFGE